MRNVWTAISRLERERIHLLLMDEASKGLDDVAASRVQDARAALTAIQKRRERQPAGVREGTLLGAQRLSYASVRSRWK